METILQTIWASLMSLGLLKIIIIVVVISIITRMQPFLGFLASVLFLAYLLHWIG